MKRKLILSALAVLVIGLFVGWRIWANQSEKITYLTEPVQRGEIVRTVNAVGEVAAVQLVSVGAQVSGQIETLNVVLGQEVKKGDLIAEIDATTQRNTLETDKARLQTYQSQLAAREIELRIAQTQYDREVKLMEKEATSAESLENANNALAAAKASVAELKSLIKQTQISISTSETNLSYTKIIAPMDGTVVSIPVEEGQTVNANQTTPTIIQLADLREMEIKMQISEGDVTKVKPGMQVEYTILSEPDQIYKGTLKSIDPGLTTLTDGTYNGAIDSGTAVYYYGKLIVPNPEGKLRIGLSTQNIITLDKVNNVLVVPTLAIQDKNGKKYVRILDKKDQVIEKEIETGLSDNMNTEVKSGLNENDRVIVAEMTAAEIETSMAQRRRGPRL